tara:strand:+ start:39 stop:659 length:621 start_codon:yes stop_codon:yes gene_type:complete
MKTKKCTKCGEEKLATREFFHKHREGLNPKCKACRRQVMKHYCEANKEEIARRAKQYRQDNKEKIAEQNKKYWSTNKEKLVKYHKKRYESNKEVILKKQKESRAKMASQQPACIYEIINKQNNLIYVGQTVKGKYRWQSHLTYLRGGYHPNEDLQADFNKFGEEAFEWRIAKEFPKDKELLQIEEKIHIDNLVDEGKKLYNIHLIS